MQLKLKKRDTSDPVAFVTVYGTLYLLNRDTEALWCLGSDGTVRPSSRARSLSEALKDKGMTPLYKGDTVEITF